MSPTHILCLFLLKMAQMARTINAIPPAAAPTPIPALAPGVSSWSGCLDGTGVTNTVAVVPAGLEVVLPKCCSVALLALVVDDNKVELAGSTTLDVVCGTTDDVSWLALVDEASLCRMGAEAGVKDDRSLDAQATYTPCIASTPSVKVIDSVGRASTVCVLSTRLHPRPSEGIVHCLQKYQYTFR